MRFLVDLAFLLCLLFSSFLLKPLIHFFICYSPSSNLPLCVSFSAPVTPPFVNVDPRFFWVYIPSQRGEGFPFCCREAPSLSNGYGSPPHRLLQRSVFLVKLIVYWTIRGRLEIAQQHAARTASNPRRVAEVAPAHHNSVPSVFAIKPP